jgi:ribosomal protein S18 acetylase RimI-like enzyme
MNIERATSKDIDQLLELMQKQFLEHEIGFNTDQLEAAIRHVLTHEGLGFILTAEDNNQLLGFAAISFAWTLEHGGKSAWLDELYVLPEHRNAGIGTGPVERVMIEAEERGCLAIDLEVDNEHRRAENLYKRKGFQKLERSRWVKRIV